MADRGFNIRSYEEAEKIVRRGFERNEAYMRSLISSVTRDGEYADGLDYSGLLRQTRRILGVAEKMLKSRGKVRDRAEDVRDQREAQGEFF